jgi:hypothetical protein
VHDRSSGHRSSDLYETAPGSHPVHRGWACWSPCSTHYALGMRHTSRRRAARDPLAPINAPTWLVIRSATGFVVESTELAPGVDPRSVLRAVRETRISDGWTAQEIGASCSFFFVARGDLRLMIAIEHRPPRDPLTCTECG